MKRGLALGLTIAPGVGLMGGFVGANKIWLTCLKCGYRFRAGAIRRPAVERLSFEVGPQVKRAFQGAVGLVTAIEGEAVMVRWSDNRTSVHLGRDLKPFVAANAEVAGSSPRRDLKLFVAASGEVAGSSPVVRIGSQVRRTVRGAVGEVTAIVGEAVTVRWPDNRTSVHLSRDLKPS
jgi:ribosomal protein L21E